MAVRHSNEWINLTEHNVQLSGKGVNMMRTRAELDVMNYIIQRNISFIILGVKSLVELELEGKGVWRFSCFTSSASIFTER